MRDTVEIEDQGTSGRMVVLVSTSGHSSPYPMAMSAPGNLDIEAGDSELMTEYTRFIHQVVCVHQGHL